jgi:hypothetical protein
VNLGLWRVLRASCIDRFPFLARDRSRIQIAECSLFFVAVARRVVRLENTSQSAKFKSSRCSGAAM